MRSCSGVFSQCEFACPTRRPRTRNARPPLGRLAPRLLTLCLPLALGCGSDLATVSGTVTLDGQPIAGGSDVRGTVTFYPRASGSLPAIGIIGENGRYELSTGSNLGAKPGSYGVAITATRIIIPEPGATPSGRPITPRRYASSNDSGLSAEVQPGSNNIDFSLSSKETGPLPRP